MFISKRSCVESTIICAMACLFLSIGLRPNSNYLPLNFLILGAVLGGVYGWIIYLTEYYGTSEWGRSSPRWFIIGAAVLGGLFGLHSISFWVFACVGIFVCVLVISFEEGHIGIKRALSLYVALGAIFGSIISIFAFYLLRGQAITFPGVTAPFLVMPKDMGTIIILGTVVGVICGLIPVVNFFAALIFGLIIGFNSQQFVYSLRKPFFMIPLFLLLAYVIANKIDKKYEHTKGSRVALVLLFVLVTTISLFVARMQGWDWGWSLVLAVPVWFLTSVALVQITAKRQKPETERRKLWNELGKVESSLSKVEDEIRVLNEEKQALRQKYEEPLRRRNELEEEINRLIASDPANLIIKAEESRKQFQGIPIDKIWENRQKTDKDIGRINRTREEYQKKLKLFEKEREALYSRLHETERKLQRLEMSDPKNVGIKLETLQRKWQNFTESELDTVKTFGEVERWFKEQCLLNLRIEAKNREIETQHHKIRNIQRSEALLQLEKLILEQEEITKSLGQDEPRLIEINNELEKLKAEQPRLIKEKSRISQILDEMQAAKPRLQVSKGLYMLLGTALVVSLLLNTFAYGFLAAPQTEPQSPLILTEWNKTYGGLREDGAHSIQQTSDGGYIIAGYTWSFGVGEADFWLVKTDAGGNIKWNKTYGGANDREWAYSIQQTGDGGYIIAGHTWSFGTGWLDVWLVKTDATGNMQWNKTYGGVRRDWGHSVLQITDGGYIIAGSTESFGTGSGDVWLVKTDRLGNMLWQKTYGGTDGDEAFDVEQTSDGGYIIAGYTKSFGIGKTDAWLIKTDSGGEIVWKKTYGGVNDDLAFSVQQISDGGYIIAGWTESFGEGNHDVWLAKTDSAGNMLWYKTYGGANNEWARSVQETVDGGYVLAGITESFGAGSRDFWLVKTDDLGNMEWQKTYGGTDGDEAFDVEQTSDGGYIIAGYTKSFGIGDTDVWLIKLKY